MSQIELRFLPRHELAMRGGQKHGTLRRSRHGEPGDIFQAFDCWFRIDAIEGPMPAWAAAQEHYGEEGAASPEELARHLGEAYGALAPDTPLHLHRFHRIGAAEAEDVLRDAQNPGVEGERQPEPEVAPEPVPQVPKARLDGYDFPLGL